MKQELKKILDICQARIDYNQALIDTINSYSSLIEIRSFYIEELIGNSLPPELYKEYVRTIVNEKDADTLKSEFVDSVISDLQFYEKVIVNLEPDSLNLIMAAILVKEQLTINEENLKFICGDAESDKFEISSLKETLSLLSLCLSESEIIFLSFIVFARGEGNTLSYFDNTKFSRWLEKFLGEANNDINGIEFLDVQGKIVGDISRLRRGIKAIEDGIRSDVQSALDVPVGNKLEDRYPEFSRLFDSIYNKFSADLDDLISQIELVKESSSIFLSQKAKSLSSISKKNNKNSKKKPSKSASTASAALEKVSITDPTLATAAEECEHTLLPGSGGGCVSETYTIPELSRKKNNREAHRSLVEKNRCLKERKEEARKEAEDARHSNRVVMTELMEASKQKCHSREEATEEFVIDESLMLRNYGTLTELFSDDVKSMTFNKVKALIVSLGGTLDNYSGGSHYQFCFDKSLKGYIKKSVAGGIARPHGKAGNEISGLNFRLLRTALEKVLSEGWEDLLQAKAEVKTDAIKRMTLAP